MHVAMTDKGKSLNYKLYCNKRKRLLTVHRSRRFERLTSIGTTSLTIPVTPLTCSGLIILARYWKHAVIRVRVLIFSVQLDDRLKEEMIHLYKSSVIEIETNSTINEINDARGKFNC